MDYNRTVTKYRATNNASLPQDTSYANMVISVHQCGMIGRPYPSGSEVSSSLDPSFCSAESTRARSRAPVVLDCVAGRPLPASVPSHRCR